MSAARSLDGLRWELRQRLCYACLAVHTSDAMRPLRAGRSPLVAETRPKRRKRVGERPAPPRDGLPLGGWRATIKRQDGSADGEQTTGKRESLAEG